VVVRWSSDTERDLGGLGRDAVNAGLQSDLKAFPTQEWPHIAFGGCWMILRGGTAHALLFMEEPPKMNEYLRGPPPRIMELRARGTIICLS
jgi:hypothetical protein